MKTKLLTCLSSFALLASAFAQEPTPSPTPPPTATPAASPVIATTPAAVMTPALAPTASPSASVQDDLERRIKDKVKRHFNVSIGDRDDDGDRRERRRDRVSHDSDVEDMGAFMAIPIVGIIFTTIFGAPVLVVAAILFFNYMRSRSLHRTVRMMVEKGQPVPPELFAAPHTPARARSDMRRGVVLIMIGIGLMVFFGAVNDWEGGAWSLGIIPFLIGAGHLLVWKLEGNKATVLNTSTDNTPRIP